MPDPSPVDRRATSLIQALVGDADTSELSTQLGFRSDVVSRWASGRRNPKAVDTLRLASLLEIPWRDAILHPDPQKVDAPAAEWLATLCSDVVRVHGATALSEGTGLSEHTIRRIARGDSSPSLAQFLSIVDQANQYAGKFEHALSTGSTTDVPSFAHAAWRLVQTPTFKSKGSQWVADCLRVPADAVPAIAAHPHAPPASPVAIQHALSLAEHNVVNRHALLLSITTGVRAQAKAQVWEQLRSGFEDATRLIAAHPGDDRVGFIGVSMSALDGRSIDDMSVSAPPKSATPACRSELHIDIDAVAAQFIRALRGKQSQRAVSLRLKYESNAVYRWEAGKTQAPAHRVFALPELSGTSVLDALSRFNVPVAQGLRELSPMQPEFWTKFVQLITRLNTAAHVEARYGMSRHRLGRLRRGENRVMLNDVLGVVHGITERLVDFIRCFVDLSQVPALHEAQRLAQARRRLAARWPQLGQALLLLRHNDYLRLPAHNAAWLAVRLDIRPEEVESLLRDHEGIGLVERHGQHYRPRPHLPVDYATTTEGYNLMATHFARRTYQSVRTGQALHQGAFFSSADANMVGALSALSNVLTRASTGPSQDDNTIERAFLLSTQLIALDGRPFVFPRRKPS